MELVSSTSSGYEDSSDAFIPVVALVQITSVILLMAFFFTQAAGRKGQHESDGVGLCPHLTLANSALSKM